MKYFLACCLLVCAFACHHALAPLASKQTTDSTATHTVYKEVVRDSTIQIPADSAWLTELLACDSNGHVLLKQLEGYKAGAHAFVPVVDISNNLLRVRSGTDSFKVYWWWKELHEKTDTVNNRRIVITIPAPPPERINYVTGFQKFMIKSAWVFYVLLLLFVAWKILANFYPILKL